MTLSPLAGKPATHDLLIDVRSLVDQYYAGKPNLDDPAQLVHFGTSGHRGTPIDGSFTEVHIEAITQAICDYRRGQGIAGPLYLGKDTHALSGPAQQTALEVLAANGVETMVQVDDGVTPVPVVSHAILTHNRMRDQQLADGIIVSPSHNPPGDGGFKYNPPSGGPADTTVTARIQDRANALLRAGAAQIRRLPFEHALHAPTTHQIDFIQPYVLDLEHVLDLQVVRQAGLALGVDPLGGASLPYWSRIADAYHLDLTVVNPRLDPTFGFMTVDHDGVIRMDCSSPYAMAGLIALKDHYGIAFGADPDADRHGIVAPSAGLLNPNHYLAVAIRYLVQHRPGWSAGSAVGKTVVSSSIIDRVAAQQGKRVVEVPVGFKWFVPGLLDCSLCFGGEESAGASFLRRDGSVWTTDKDGLLLDLLAAEITARTGKDPGEHYREITDQLGASWYTRIDVAADAAQREVLRKLAPESVTVSELAGEPIVATFTRAPGNDAPIEGLKVVAANGWFAARPSGTEDIYKIYAESFAGQKHLETIVDQAQAVVRQALGRST